MFYVIMEFDFVSETCTYVTLRCDRREQFEYDDLEEIQSQKLCRMSRKEF